MSAPARDSALLDAIERLPQQPYEGRVWRSVGQGREPTDCWRTGGRWDDRTFDVLYTSETRAGAINERRFHLYMGQPIVPSKLTYELYEIEVELRNVIDFPDVDALKNVGMATGGYGHASYLDKEKEYPPSQIVAEACFFLGSDGVRVPNARHDSLNLVVFCEQSTKMTLTILKNHGVIDWATA